MLRQVCLIVFICALFSSAAVAQHVAGEPPQKRRFASYFTMPKDYTSPRTLQRLNPIKMLIAEKRYDQALYSIDSMMSKADPATRIYLLGLKQSVYTQEMNAEKIMEAAKELRSALPDTGYMYFRFGAEVGMLNGWTVQGDFDNAKAQFQNMIEMFGTQVTDFELYLAMVCTRMINAGKADELDLFLRQLEEKYPAGKVGYYVQADLFHRELKKDHFEVAERRLQNICKKFPDEDLAHNSRKIQQSIDLARKNRLEKLGQSH